MPIEFRCPQCGKLLRTPDASAGKKGKCPHCQSVNDIPLASTAPQEKPIEPLFPQTPAPRIERPESAAPFGAPGADPFASPPGLSPYPSSPLSNDPFASLPSSTPATGPGQTDLFADLPSSSPLSPSSAGAANPFGPSPSSAGGAPFGAPSPAPASGNPYSAPSYAASQPSFGYQSNLQPHRGGMVLALGIISLIAALGGSLFVCCCGLFGLPFTIIGGITSLAVGIPAGVLGNIDLRKMKEGTMDPSGRGLTMTGFIMSIVAIVLLLVSVLLFIALFALGIGMQAMNR